MPNSTKMYLFETGPHVPLTDYLARDGVLDMQVAKETAIKAAQCHLPLTSYLVKHNILDSDYILNYCAKKFALPIFNLNDENKIYLSKISVLKPELIHRYHVIPLSISDQELSLGITDPTDHTALTAIAFHTGLSIHPFLIGEDSLDLYIQTYHPYNKLESQLESTLSKIHLIEEIKKPEDAEEDEEPIIQCVDRLLQDALEKGSSDIHIEPYAQHCRIRFRCDGILSEIAILPTALATRIITRLKVMANLNIAEKRLPQDGRIYLQSQHINIRINCCPTLFGEKIVLRLLNNHGHLKIDHLGFTAEQKSIFLHALSKPQGLILVTGPTGSGKTLTLYSALHYLNQIEKNISTIEDPVEIELDGITQLSINPKIGLDFPEALRAFLRQDPDILMVGEIRDLATAYIAIQAAQTGHLVLSTLHTNNAAETPLRLQSLGLEIQHLTHALSLIIAQRLVRKLCDHCKQTSSDPVFYSTAATLKNYKPAGCIHCHQGYKGRTGIFELLPFTHTVSDRIQLSNTAQLKKLMKEENYPSLWETGIQKVATGITSYAELTRVINCP